MGAAEDLNSDDIISSVETFDRIVSAVIYVSRPSIRSLLVREFKACGVPNVQTAEDAIACIDWMVHNPTGLLVVDWDHGEDDVKRILKSAQSEHGIDTRPIYLLGYDNSQRLISIAHEWNVMQLHTGEISKAQIEKNLKDLLNFSLLSPLCRETFIKVAAARREQRGKDALELMRTLHEAEPENLRAAVEYGSCLCEDGSLGFAIEHLTSVSMRYPFELKTKHLLARAYMKLGDFDRAVQHLEDAELIDPKSVERLCELGRALLNQERLDKAMGKFNEALALDSDCHDAKIGKAQCQLLSGQMNEGLKLLGQMRDPQELASVFNGAAIIAIRKKNFKQGLTLYKTAVGYLSEDHRILARVFFNMGLGLTKWGKPTLAIAAFQRASTLDPEFKKAKHNAKLLAVLSKKGVSLEGLARDAESFAPAADRGKESMQIPTADDDLDDDYVQAMLNEI